MPKKITPKKLDPVKRVKTRRVKTSLKFERITLITATETYHYVSTEHQPSRGTTALDEIIPLIKKYGVDVNLISYENGNDLELIEGRGETNE